MISKKGRPIEVLALLLCATTAPAQENRGSPERRAACAPAPTSIEHCLRQSMSDLREAGRSVFQESAGVAAGRTKQG